jgi:DNA (cytosine-5)-methyltransferase 1
MELLVEVICGGFPCKTFPLPTSKAMGSTANAVGFGSSTPELFATYDRATSSWRTSAELLNRGMDRVLGTLADLGYDVEWRVLRGLDVGLPFIGERVWIVATAGGARREGRFQYLGSLGIETMPSAERRHQAIRARRELEAHLHSLRADDGLSVSMERRRLYGLGNAVTPQIPEAIGRAIMNTRNQLKVSP